MFPLRIQSYFVAGHRQRAEQFYDTTLINSSKRQRNLYRCSGRSSSCHDHHWNFIYIDKKQIDIYIYRSISSKAVRVVLVSFFFLIENIISLEKVGYSLTKTLKFNKKKRTWYLKIESSNYIIQLKNMKIEPKAKKKKIKKQTI